MVGLVRSTLMFTDGLANRGLTNSEAISTAASAKLGELQDDRCTVSTFGFGSNHDSELLQSLANTGEGVYSYIEGEDTIGEAFGEAMGGLLTTSHQNVELSLQLAPGSRLVKAHTEFPVKKFGDRLDVVIGDLFAEERKNILLELELPESSEGVCMIGEVCARGFRVMGPPRSEETEHVALKLRRQGGTLPTQQGHPQVVQHRNRRVATKALADARAAAKNGDLTCALKLLQAAMDTLAGSSAASSGNALTLGLLVDLKDLLKDLEDKRSYEDVGSKKMSRMHYAHGMERSSYGAKKECFSEMYSNSVMKESKRTYGKSCV